MNDFSLVRLGILGCGRIVTRRILPGSQSSTDAKVVAIASQRVGIAAGVASDFNIPQSYDSYEELLASDEIDAVYIPTTGDQHHQWTIAAAKAGKHVLCEKPLAPTFTEAEKMVAACEENNVLLQEAFMWRHHNRPVQMKSLVDEGAIGSLRLINVNFSFDIDRSDWRLDPQRGGGAMWDLGCYGVNASRFFTGAEPARINADAHWWTTGVDMTMRIGLAFPGEVLANIDCSFEAPFRCRLELVGDNGHIVVEPAFQPDEAPSFQLCRSADRDSPYETIQCDPKDQYACQLDAFAEAVRGGQLVDGAEDGLQNMRVMQQVLDAAKANKM